MATITPGTGATVQSPTIEGQFVQLIEYFQVLEASGTTNYFSGNYDSDSLKFSGNFKIPVVLASNAMTYSGDTDNFLTGTFTPGTGGTFNAPLALNYFLQVLAQIHRWQNDSAKNPNKNNFVNSSLNLNSNQISGNFDLPLTRTITATGITFTPATYLM